MGKIHFVAAADAFHGRVEIAEAQIREFFADQFHQLFYAHAFTGVGDTYLSQVPIGIDIEITPLDHREAGAADDFTQCFVFGNAIGHAGEDEIIDGGPAAKAVDDPEAFDDVFETVIIWPVIGFVNGGTDGVQADADRVETGFAEGLDGRGFRTVGVDIDAPAGGLFTHGDDRFPDRLPHEQGLAFAALSKAHDGEWRFLEMGNGEFDDLLGQGLEGKPVLG